MPLFQYSILKRYIASESDKIVAAYGRYVDRFLDPNVMDNMRNTGDEQIRQEFIHKLFIDVLGYTFDDNLILGTDNEPCPTKADGEILVDGDTVGVIEIKNSDVQSFGYATGRYDVPYVVITDCDKLRFYIGNASDFAEFRLFSLSPNRFAQMWVCLAYENIARNLPTQIHAKSDCSKYTKTRNLYRDCSTFRRNLFIDLCTNNPEYDKLLLFRKAHKLLARMLFVLSAEDGRLLPENFIRKVVEQWEKLRETHENYPLYHHLKTYSSYINPGRRAFADDNGLFDHDKVLDDVVISDNALHIHALRLSRYDFRTDVDTNTLAYYFAKSADEAAMVEEIANAVKSKVRKPEEPKKVEIVVEASSNRIGRIGENKAANWMIEHGFTILSRNWKMGNCEIDIIAVKGDKLHLVEVKTRNYAITSKRVIDRRKLRALLHATRIWLLSHNFMGELGIDLIGVRYFPDETYSIEYVPDAITNIGNITIASLYSFHASSHTEPFPASVTSA